MDEVEQKLGLTVTPLSFPIGMGYDFKEYTTYGNKT
jgi:peptide chain release factor 3